MCFSRFSHRWVELLRNKSEEPGLSSAFKKREVEQKGEMKFHKLEGEVGVVVLRNTPRRATLPSALSYASSYQTHETQRLPLQNALLVVFKHNHTHLAFVKMI